MDACIGWKGAVRKDGYGTIPSFGTTIYAHRVAIGAKNGDVVRHLCDNRKCVNPAHLRIGSQADNIADMVAKNRQARGSRHGCAKLDEETIPFVRAYHGVLDSRKTAKIFGVGQQTILRIWNKETWRHV